MHDSEIMQMLNTQNQLSDNLRCHVFLDGSVLSHILEQILSLDEFCDNVQMSFGLDGLFVENEQWMVKNAHDAAFMSGLIEIRT
jgi:hypothetical protein